VRVRLPLDKVRSYFFLAVSLEAARKAVVENFGEPDEMVIGTFRLEELSHLNAAAIWQQLEDATPEYKSWVPLVRKQVYLAVFLGTTEP